MYDFLKYQNFYCSSVENLNIWGKEEHDTQKIPTIFKWCISLALQVAHLWSVTMSLLKSDRCCFICVEEGREQVPSGG